MPLTSLAWGFAVFLMPERYVPIILFWKAKQLRKLTGQSRLKASIELKKVAFRRQMKHAFTRPFRFIYKDKILAVLIAYTGLIYIITYQTLSAVPLMFANEYSFTLTHEGLGAMAEVAIMIHQALQRGFALSLFGGLSILIVPVPFLLHRYAYKIQKSKYRSQTEDYGGLVDSPGHNSKTKVHNALNITESILI